MTAAGIVSIPGAQKHAPGWVLSEIRAEHLPSGLNGKTIVFATDIHINRLWKDVAIDRLLSAIGEKKPDLVLWGGDYAESDEHAHRFFDAAAKLKPPLGMYGVLGNNDYESFDGKIGELRKIMKRSGVFPLVNRASTIDLSGGRLIIAGADELKYGHPSSRMLRGYVGKHDFRILLCHSPQTVDLALQGIEKKPQLTLAGHTHGGQFSALGLTLYSLGYERRQLRGSEYFYVTGERQFGDMRMIVSNGVGTSKIPLRIGAQPELNIIRLYA